MARTKSDKAQKAHPSKPKPSGSTATTSNGPSKPTETKQNSSGRDTKKPKKTVSDPMKAVGGEEADLELIKGADAREDEDLVTGDAAVEVRYDDLSFMG